MVILNLQLLNKGLRKHMIGMNRKVKTALITGVTGQDGSYLAEFLLNKDYRVIGLKRRTSTICTERIDHIFEHENFELEYFDLNDVGCMWRLLTEYRPDEIYNLAAQSHVKGFFRDTREHCRRRSHGHHATTRGHQKYSARCQILSGIIVRDVWR